MEYDFNDIPKEPSSDTPELIQECVDLRAVIASQLDDWYELLSSHHPAIRMGGIGKIIAANATPKPQDTTDLQGSPFETGLTPGKAKIAQQKREQQAKVAEIAQDHQFDEVTPIEGTKKEDELHEYFDRALYISQNPDFPNTSADAIHYLFRIYNADTQAASHLAPSVNDDVQSYKYMCLLSRIVQDSAKRAHPSSKV